MISWIPWALALVGVAVAAQWWWLRARGRDPLGPSVGRALPDTGRALLAVLFAYLAAPYLMALLWERPPRDQAGAVHILLGQGVLLAVALAALPSAMRVGPATLEPGGRARCGVLGGLAIYGVAAVIALGVQAAYAVAGAEPPQQAVVALARDAVGADLAAVAVTAVVLAPVAEEILYRGIVLPAFARATNVRTAVVAQAVLFGSMHVLARPETWPLAIPLAAVGAGLGVLYVRTRSLSVPFLAHMTFNALHFTVLRLTG